ncbi:hypothetical protein D3C80_1740300 [compost metagenome]
MPEKITANTLRAATAFCSGTLKLPASATTCGAMGDRVLRILSVPRLRTTRNRADSGNHTINTSASSSGSTPPITSRLCQP